MWQINKHSNIQLKHNRNLHCLEGMAPSQSWQIPPSHPNPPNNPPTPQKEQSDGNEGYSLSQRRAGLLAMGLWHTLQAVALLNDTATKWCECFTLLSLSLCWNTYTTKREVLRKTGLHSVKSSGSWTTRAMTLPRSSVSASPCCPCPETHTQRSVKFSPGRHSFKNKKKESWTTREMTLPQKWCKALHFAVRTFAPTQEHGAPKVGQTLHSVVSSSSQSSWC